MIRAVLFVVCFFAAPVYAQDTWNGTDKKLHFILIGAIPAFIVGTQTKSPWKGFATGVALGALKEVLDEANPDNRASGKDFIVTIAGAALGAYGSKWMIGYNDRTTVISYRTTF